MAYCRNAGGTRSPALNSIAQRILQFLELHHVHLAPQFIMGSRNVLADSLSRPNQIQGSEGSPHGSLSGAPPPVAGNDRPVCYLSKSPPVMLPLRLDLLSQPRSRHRHRGLFMPGDSPAICQGRGILLPSRCSGWLCSVFFLSHQLSAEVVCVLPVVQVGGPLSFSALSS